VTKSLRTLVDHLGPVSYAEIEEFFVELRRRQILAGDIDGDDRTVIEKLLRAWKVER